MLARFSAVVQHVFIVAPSVLKSVSRNGHAVEGFLLVDTIGKSKDGGSEPGNIEGDGEERVAENFADNSAVGNSYSPLMPGTEHLIGVEGDALYHKKLLASLLSSWPCVNQ